MNEPKTTTTTTTNESNTTLSMVRTETGVTPARDVPTAERLSPHERRTYEAILARAEALPREKLRPVNVDPAMTAALCVTVAKRMRPQRDKLARMVEFDLDALDQLEPAGSALLVAHGDYRSAVAPREELRKLVADGNAMRDRLQRWGETLSHDGLLRREVCVKLRRATTSHRELATTLESWVQTLRNDGDWARIQRASTLDEATLQTARDLGLRIIEATGERQFDPARVARATKDRMRIFSLAARYYEEVRRGAAYLRWYDGDVDDWAPSLFRKWNRRAAKKAAGVEATRVDDTPRDPSAAVGAAGGPGARVERVGDADRDAFRAR